MNTSQKIRQAKLAKWAALFKDQSDSGLTVRQWCDQNNYTIHAYNYWKHILKETALKNVEIQEIVPIMQPSANEVSLPVASDIPANPSRKLRESPDTTPQASPVSISLGDIRIEIGSGASDDVISGIIKAVRHA